MATESTMKRDAWMWVELVAGPLDGKTVQVTTDEDVYVENVRLDTGQTLLGKRIIQIERSVYRRRMRVPAGSAAKGKFAGVVFDYDQKASRP